MIIVKVPTVGESITEVTLIKWRKKNGEYVKRDEVIAELESEKATFELNAEQSGSLVHKAPEGTVLKIGDDVATIDPSATPEASNTPAPLAPVPTPAQSTEAPRCASTRSIFVTTPIVRSPRGSTLRLACNAAELAKSTSAADIAKIIFGSRIYFSHSEVIFSRRLAGWS